MGARENNGILGRHHKKTSRDLLIRAKEAGWDMD